MSKKKLEKIASLTPRRATNKWVFLATIVAVCGIGFAFIGTYAAGGTSKTYYYNSTGIGHNHGSAKTDNSYVSYTVWQDVRGSGASWYGPRVDQPKDLYSACFWLRTVSGGDDAKVYLDVVKKVSGSFVKITSDTVYPADAEHYDSGYGRFCLPYSLSGEAKDVEFRADVQAGKVNIAKVRITRY